MVNKMKMIELEKIIIPEKFTKTKPSEVKVNTVHRYVAMYGELDKPLVLDNNNVLTDNYIRYLVAKETNMISVPYLLPEEYKEKYPQKNRMSYIVGVFYNCGKRYVWKNSKNLKIEIGDKVLVESKDKFGNDNKAVTVTVVKTFKSSNPALLVHKSVIKQRNKNVE